MSGIRDRILSSLGQVGDNDKVRALVQLFQMAQQQDAQQGQQGQPQPSHGLPGTQTFLDPKQITRGDIPISGVGPGTLGGMPFRPNPTAEGIAGVGGILANLFEGRRVSKAQGEARAKAAEREEQDDAIRKAILEALIASSGQQGGGQ